MTVEEIADRFDNRTGHKLVAYGAVGLPLYRLTTVGLCLAKKSLDPIEEFVLRSVLAGAESLAETAGFLGLQMSVIDSCVADLIRMECVRLVSSTSSPSSLSQIELTSKGRELASDLEATVPLEQTVIFCVDGLTRSPRFHPSESLYKPLDLREQGIPEVRAFPARPPNLDEIDIKDVIEVVRLDAGRADTPRQLLRINSIERRDRVFLEAVALAYRAELGNALHVAFAIDGRLSQKHERAFAKVGGPKKTRLFRGLDKLAAPPPMVDMLGEDLSHRVERAAQGQPCAEELQREARVVRAGLNEARLESGQTPHSGSEHSASDSGRRLKDVKARLEQLEVRPLAVYEHPPLLERAIGLAEERVLLISPWIRRAVVTRRFVDTIRESLNRGVRIYIGYGLSEEDKDEKTWDKDARTELEKLAERFEGFTFQLLGNTHAKVLIKDREFFVISSFNWLSFRGDPNRTFREEWGTLVAIPSVVEEYFQQMVRRFRVAEDG